MHIGIPARPEIVSFNSIDRLHMENQTLPDDFKEFLKLLNDHKVEYLLIGGYAVGYHGYPRTTADIDISVFAGWKPAVRIAAILAALSRKQSEFSITTCFPACGNYSSLE